jgi:hypothetical protein
MSRKYNFIYSKLVEDNDDVVGHIAYSLYKNEKIEFIETFKEKHGSEPTELDLEPFHISSCTNGSLERFKRMAIVILQEFTNELLGRTIKDIEHNVISNHKKYLRETVDEIKPPSIGMSYLHGILQSVLGAFLFLLLMAGIIFAFNLNKKGTTISINDSSMNVEQTTIKDSINGNKK